MEVIEEYAEKASPVKPSQCYQHNSTAMEQLSASDLEYNYDKQGLADLRRRLHRAVANYLTAFTQYKSAVLEVSTVPRTRRS